MVYELRYNDVFCRYCIAFHRRCICLLVTGRNAGIKITFVSFFWFHRPVGATLCTDYRQIWQGRGGRQHLTTKVENFRGSFGELRPKKN